jgi:hypothetical protein
MHQIFQPQIQALTDQAGGVAAQMAQFIAQRGQNGGGKIAQITRDITRLADTGGRRGNAAFQKSHQPRHQRQHQRDTQQVEQRVKHGQPKREILRANAKRIADMIYQPPKGRNQRQRCQRCDKVENQVPQRQPLALIIGRGRADQRCNCCADIRTNRHRKRVFIADLPAGQRGDNQKHRGMAGLHHHSGPGPQQRIDSQPRQPAKGQPCQIKPGAESLKPRLDKGNPRKISPIPISTWPPPRKPAARWNISTAPKARSGMA